jgi:hypothetical protein
VDRDFHRFQLQGGEFLQVAAKGLQVAVDADLINFGPNADQGPSPFMDVSPGRTGRFGAKIPLR